MNFKNFYKPGTCRFSFEVFPVKTEKGLENLLQALKKLVPFNPAYISVTYGAMGSTRDLTEDLALKVHQETNIPVAFHFTCVGSSCDEIKTYVQKLKKEGLYLIVALRGDPPDGAKDFVPPQDGFRYANELVSFLKEIDGFSIAVAGYPEKHIEAPDPKTDLENLKRKVNAGADIIMTQLFFNNKVYFDFVDRAQKIGIKIPIIPGIMPIINVKQIERITSPCGASIPDDLYKQLRKYQDDAEAVCQIGIDHAIQQCSELISRGVPGIHFYTLNKSYSVRKVMEGIK